MSLILPIMSELVIPCLTFRPIPVVASVLTRPLKLIDVIAVRIAVVFSPVITPAGVLIQVVADGFGHPVGFLDGGIRVLAPV